MLFSHLCWSSLNFNHTMFVFGRFYLGQKFAGMEEKVMLSTFLRRFKVRSEETLEELQVLGELITRPMNGVKVQLTVRDTQTGNINF